MAPQIRHATHDDQARHAQPPGEFDQVIRSSMLALLSELADRPTPVKARWLRSETASRYLGKYEGFLQEDRRDAAQEKRSPRFPFRKLGSAVVYDVRDLDRVMDALPRVGESV